MKHTWKLDKNGHIDDMAYDVEVYDSGDHNGPRCTVCGFYFCEACARSIGKNCYDSEQYPCPGEPPEGKTWFWTGSERDSNSIGFENDEYLDYILEVRKAYILTEQYRIEKEAVEEAIEKAIQGGEHGVLITRNSNGVMYSVEVSKYVPYGNIYELIDNKYKYYPFGGNF